MTVRRTPAGDIELLDACPVEDAEVLLQHLLATPAGTVDWRACEHAHTAVIQVLLAAEATVRGPPRSASLREWVEPLLDQR